MAGYSDFQSDGSDIRFTASDNSTNLDYEIESWDVNGNSYVWVRIPTVAAGGTTTIFMYFDNPSATLGSNPTSLWTRYNAVWHLEESASGTAPQFKDSTAAAKHGTAVSGPTTAAGIIGNALDLNGNYDSMDVGSLMSTLGGSATLSYWIKTNQTGNNTNYLAPGVTGVEQAGGVIQWRVSERLDRTSLSTYRHTFMHGYKYTCIQTTLTEAIAGLDGIFQALHFGFESCTGQERCHLGDIQ